MRLVRLPSLSMPAIEIHRLDLDLDADPMGIHAQLAPQERERAMSFACRADRVRCAHTRAALRRLLADRLGCAPLQVPLTLGTHGKPRVDSAHAPVFNVAHAGAHALIAIAGCRAVAHVGIDIERERDEIDLRAIAGLAFSHHEQAAFAGSRTGFYRGWVLKEALLKAIGVGVAQHLLDVGIRLAPGEPPRIECASNPPWAAFRAAELPAPPGHAAALAWRTQDT